MSCVVDKTSSSFHQSWQSYRSVNLLCTRYVSTFVDKYDLLIPPIQRLNEISATVREPQGEDDTPEKLEAERQAAQEFIDTGNITLGYTPYFR
jgi:hypothetical protein